MSASGQWLGQPVAVLKATAGSQTVSALVALSEPHYNASVHTLTFKVSGSGLRDDVGCIMQALRCQGLVLLRQSATSFAGCCIRCTAVVCAHDNLFRKGEAATVAYSVACMLAVGLLGLCGGSQD